MCTSVAPIFPWRDEYCVGVPEIDAQHQELVSLLNEMHAAMQQGYSHAALGRILHELVRYAYGHFAYEEEVLYRRGYAGLVGRRAEHDRLTQQLADLQQRCQSAPMSAPVAQQVAIWLRRHIETRP